MARELVMPKLGLTMSEGTIIKWFLNEGDNVSVGDRLFEVETDKLTNETTADTAGILRKILVFEGEAAPVKALVGVIANENEDISNIIGEAGEITDEAQPVVEFIEEVNVEKEIIVNKSDYILATPFAKKLAGEKNIDLSKINPSGNKGVILAKNVEEFKEAKVKITPAAKKMAEENNIDLGEIKKYSRIYKSDVLPLVNSNQINENNETEKATGVRRIVAQRMKSNWVTTPMVTYNMEADMTELIKLRESLKPIYAKEGLKLTYNHIAMKILSKVLVKYRYLNASFEDDMIIYHNQVNIGIAVDSEKGLLVPNVKGAESKSLREIAKEVEQLIEKAKNNSISPDDLKGGTFTVTNIGMFGMESFTPIVNKPEVAILGLNQIADKTVVINKEVVVRPMMNLSLTTDHSLVDGGLSARFLKEIKDMIENPYLLID